MTITDPRQPVFIKLPSGKFKPVGKLNDACLFDPIQAPGLWMHHEFESSRGMTRIAKLEELPSSAVSFAAVMAKTEELTEVIRDQRARGASMMGEAEAILKWIARKAEA